MAGGIPFCNEIGLLLSFKDDADDLERKLSNMRAKLLYAERSGVENETNGQRDLLSKLKVDAYDADDLLDEIRTQAVLWKQQREVQNQNQLAKKVREFLFCANPIHFKFKLKMSHRMKELRENIDKIETDMHDFGLVEAGPRPQAEFKRPETISVVDEKKIVGRDDEKEKIVKLLLETGGDHDVSVIPIVGLGGLGKTTLAQLAFNDGRVTGEPRFDLRVWVCVSTDFNMKTIAKPVISAARENCDDLDNANAVARCLVKIFSEKRFLLVLDDVWNEDQGKWEELKVLFKDGTKGSKILVTTRSEKVAEIMKTTEQPHRLKVLSYDDCWTLFKRRAFSEGEENDYPSLVEIGKQIVMNCGGVPLAANALGSMMRFKSRTEDAWSAIRDSEIWSLEEEKEILPSLKLSYIQMPSALKQCFAYCSIFPKYYEIDKDDLIRQWIALGFISSGDKSSSMEDIGNEYFNDLLWMSFLEDVRKHWKSEKIFCRMPDLVRDLAQRVAGDEVVIVGEETTMIPENCRYALINGSFMPRGPTTLVPRLRAIQFRESASLTTFYSEAKHLRLLNLHDSEISILPSSIGKLKFLRYLNLSGTNIQELSESITNLGNLQSLNLSGCHEIRTLPKYLGRLENLQNLDLSRCDSLTILDSISSLQNLNTLNLSSCTKVISLKPICHLKNVHYLDLSNLNFLVTLPESIGNLKNLRILNLSDCRSLLSLPSSSSDLQHLEKLDISYCRQLCELPKMIENLTKLRELLNYDGWELKGMPRGIGKLVSLRELSLFVIGKQNHVEHCASISELEHLRLVGKLEIKGLENVMNPVDAKAANLIEKNLRSLKLKWNVLSAAVGMDTVQLAEEIVENLQPHQNLVNLKIEGYGGGKFPSWMMNGIGSCLENLVKIKLMNIPKCSSLPPLGQLRSLKVLYIWNVPLLTNINASANKFPALTRLLLGCMPKLQEWMTVDDEEGRRERVSIFPCLTHLTLYNCPQLRPEPCLPASVENLTISRTSKENLSLILEGLRELPNKGLRELTIEDCLQVTCLPESLGSLTSLQSLTIRGCEDLERIDDWLRDLTELQSLYIEWCQSLQYLPALNMTTRKGLHIHSCPLLPNADGHFADHIKYVRVIKSEVIAFPVVKGVVDKLRSTLSNEIRLLRSFKDDADDLRSNFSAIQAVLLDAEERTIVEKETHALRHWLRKLKGAAYDADDLLDEVRTQAEKVNLMFKFKMARRMKELRENIDKIAKQRHDFGLVEAGPRRQAEFKRPQTISVVDEKKIVGRDEDKERIVKLLLETASDHDVSVIPIVGLGGLGKTTLAQLAFNDERVTGEQHFDLRVWVYVSTDFDTKKIAKAVMSTTGEKCNDLDTLESATSFLLSIFSHKRFLLVLDDVWNEEQDKWENLKVLFKGSKKGSKILVTTRSEEVAAIMKSVKPHRVKGLSDDDCWTLFKRRAFEEGEENDYPHLVEIGKQIVNKCGGLPLAVNALGSMMRFKNRTEDAWLAISDNEIWSLKEEKTILPSLKFSYIQMPSALKQCFAYCSIFPKDYVIDKDDLIQQWIALGFISSSDKCTSMEDIGNEYFNYLLWMSFLQDVEETYRRVNCRMHDLVHDLAQSVAREEVAVIVGEESTSIPEGCRYASIHSRFVSNVPTTVVWRLRALQHRESALPMTFYSATKCLRLLDLQDSKISVLPSSIGKLKLLRYLNLSSTNIKELPESITGLCNLQALNLSFCQEIHTLPKFLGRLANLRILNLSKCSRLQSLPSSSSDLQHLEKLDISHCHQLCELPKMIQKLSKLRDLLNYGCWELKGVPRGIGKLVSLRELPLFVIGKQNHADHCASISELEHLKLVSELEIKGLKNVTNPIDAKAANLIEKNLRSLKLKWNVLSAAEDMDTVQPAEEMDAVLQNLQPHQNLANLVIEGYAGRKFPSWMMNRIDSCLPNLVEINLLNMPRCSLLPPLGQLPFLETLTIRDMPAITNMGVEFYGGSHINASANKFPALRRLELSSMPVLQEWVTVDDKEGRRERVPIFPCLTELSLYKCPQLSLEPCLPASVENLIISGTSEENLSLILECATMYSERLPDDGDAVSLQQPNKGLRRLTIQECQQVTCLPESLRSLTSLRILRINGCEDLERIEDWLGELTELQSLFIGPCNNLRYLPVHKMTTLQELYIDSCPRLFNADGQFVDTSVTHIEYVHVNGGDTYEKEVSR